MQWKKSTPTAREIRSYAAAADVRTGMAKLYALPGLRLLGTRHYSATCTAAQVSAFLQFFYGTSQKTLAMDKIKDCHGELLDHSAGWLVKVGTTGRSSIVHLAISEVLAYNQRLTITAP